MNRLTLKTYLAPRLSHDTARATYPPLTIEKHFMPPQNEHSIGSGPKDAIGLEAVYSQACGALKHYSLMLRYIRTLAVVQGMTLIGGGALLLREQQFGMAMLVAVFGITLTGIIWQQNQHYLRHTRCMSNYLAKFEESHADGVVGPYAALREMRQSGEDKRPADMTLKQRGRRFMLNKAVYIVLCLVLFILFAYSVVKIALESANPG